MFTNDAINWPSRVTIDDESFPEDTLGRGKYAQFLTQFLIAQG
jgi:hypothetical protein